jgi:tRNA G18 (ribose-2'-O)-methylase SpoU
MVIDVALNSGCIPRSLLTDERLLDSESVRAIIKRLEEIENQAEVSGKTTEIPIYTASREVLTDLTGFELTRGALAAFGRPKEESPESVLKGAKRVAVLEEITDSTNVGAIFRSAAALGIDGVLLTPTCCDPLSRRALRVSMGTVLRVPYARIGESLQDWPEEGLKLLSSYGFKTASMALSNRSVSISHSALNNEERLAIILGTEGTGLKKETIAASDYTVKIPMFHGVDSLNVAAAAAVAFWQLCAVGKEEEAD